MRRRATGLAVLLLPLGLLLAQSSPSERAQVDSAAAERVVNEGREIFHGVGTCLGCHGAKLEGTALAPTLLSHKWRNGDGSLAAIVHIVSSGVPNTAMISHPGGINDGQVAKVAAYVWAVSHGKAAL